MIKEIFTSGALIYRNQLDLESALGGDPLPIAHYNEYLITPPRMYAETINQIKGMAVIREKTATSITKIAVFVQTDQYYWPGYNFWIWKFDCTTGQFLEISATPSNLGSLLNYMFYQSSDGSIWGINSYGQFFEIDLNTYDVISGSLKDPSFYSVISFISLITDRVNNLLIFCGTGYDDYLRAICVSNFNTGALIRIIRLPGQPVVIMPEDSTRCWVLTNNSLLCLIDYTTGEVIKTILTPIPTTSSVNIGSVPIACYDTYTRRIYYFEQKTDATDGQGQSIIHGYYPIPLSTYLTKPIPLKQPRKGRTIPILTRTVGDIGEPILGQVITLTPSGNITGAPSGNATDQNGDLIANYICGDAGSATLNASMDNGL